MNKTIVKVKEKEYSVSNITVVLKLNSGPLIHLRLSEKLDGTENRLSNEETFKQEFFQDICQEVEGSFEWGGQTIKFILVGYNSSEARTFELVGLVVKKDVIEWFNENSFKDKKQDYLIYQKSNGGNSWPWFNKVLGNKFEQPNPDLVDKIKFLFPDNACILRYKDSNNFQFLNRSMAFASRHLPEVQGWCAFDADKPLRLILFEEKKQDNSIPKLDQTWNPSHLFLPNRYSWNRLLDKSCTLSRDLSINTGQEIALIKQLVSDGSNGEDAQKGQDFQAQNPTRLLFTPGTINIGDRNIFCHTVSYEFKLPAFEEKESPSVTMKIEMDYPERHIGDNEVISLRLFGKFQRWEKEKDEETKVKIAPPDLNNWGIIDEKDQRLKSGDDAVLYTQILSPTYSDKKYSGIYIKHEKDDEMIVDIHPGGIPLVLGSVQKYRKELEEADITLCGEKLAISVSSHSQSLASAEAIILDNSEIKLNHGKKIFGQAQQQVDFLSQNIELGSSQIEINSGQTKINSLVNVSFPSPKVPTPNVPAPKQVFMKGLDGKTKVLQITPNTKISELKKALGYESADVYLTYGGKPLKEESTVADYPNIQEGSNIEIRGRMRGGTSNSNSINQMNLDSDTDSDDSEYQDDSLDQGKKRKEGDFYKPPSKRKKNDGITSTTVQGNKTIITRNTLFDGTERPKEYGEVTIEKETINHVQGKKIERPVKVSGLVYPIPTKGRSSAPEPASGIQIGAKKHDGVPPHRNTGITDADKGHIMALELGGPDTPDNIVPQWSQWQRNGKWRQAERDTLKLADDAGTRGNKLYFEANVEYKTYEKVEQGTRKGVAFPNKFKTVVTEKDKHGNDVPGSSRVMFEGEQDPDEIDEKLRGRLLDSVDHPTITDKNGKPILDENKEPKTKTSYASDDETDIEDQSDGEDDYMSIDDK